MERRRPGASRPCARAWSLGRPYRCRSAARRRARAGGAARPAGRPRPPRTRSGQIRLDQHDGRHRSGWQQSAQPCGVERPRRRRVYATVTSSPSVAVRVGRSIGPTAMISARDPSRDGPQPAHRQRRPHWSGGESYVDALVGAGGARSSGRPHRVARHVHGPPVERVQQGHVAGGHVCASHVRAVVRRAHADQDSRRHPGDRCPA
jgi:hypothetical protein